MRIQQGQLVLSPSDLSNFLSCRHRAGLDLAVAWKVMTRPAYSNPYAAILQKHGEEHENAYVESIRAAGLTVVNARPDDKTTADQSSAITVEAMRRGADTIVQARLAGDRLGGYADILYRVERPSALGNWSYEAHDTKLTRETKGSTILQLSAYSHLLAEMQGTPPEFFHVVTPVATERYRVADYAAYHRMVHRTLLQELAKGHEQLIAEHYPEPVEACQVCVWAARCEARRRRDDHLSYIAGSGRSHRVELTAQGFPTLTAVAEMPVPVTFKPSRGARETYDRIGNQARVQHQQRTEKRSVFEELPIEEGQGLRRLPEPSPGDLFLDLEGASFAREGGREFLFGIWSAAGYQAWWATDDAEERAAFESVMDLITAAVQADPAMHVYHFNHYEPTAFKKLASRYVTRVEPLNEMLRAERFVDLYPIVRQAVRAGVESYSIKKLEQYYNFRRNVALLMVHEPLMAVERALEAKAPDAIPPDIRDAVQGYNEDDCRSTQALRDWLEALRAKAVESGHDVPRPQLETKDARKVIEIQLRAEALREKLLAAIPPEAADPVHTDHPKWLLAYLIDWHRREVNAEWWEYFRLRNLPEEDLFEERKAVAGLEFVERVDVVRRVDNGKPTGSVIDRYRYPLQEIELKGSLNLQTGKKFGDIAAHDRQARTLDIKKGPSRAEMHPTALFALEVINIDVLQESVMRLAASTLADPGAFDNSCGLQLLLGRSPRLTNGKFNLANGESAQQFAIRIAKGLDRTVLPIQGPPGAGKTFVGAQMIRSLVEAGKKVGVTATSHKVIRNLLAEVEQQAANAGEKIQVGARVGKRSTKPETITEFDGDENGPALLAIANGEVNILGGTAWLWADDGAKSAVDVLFVDEAGQMSLANVLAVSQAANSLVLLGDPQQLDQPEKGSHPDGVGISALEHVLGDHETMPAARGIFLPITWRMSPALTAFTSELFYDAKLISKDGLECQVLSGVDTHSGSRLWMVAVDHDGNQSASDEEVDAVAALVGRLLAPGSMWTDEKGNVRQMTGADLRVVAPFNAQVNRLAERLASLDVPVGTVDKFQGQTCAVVIYSMATSRPEDAPRGMEFLYSLNRLNVATSRARCAVFLVASPRLFEPECRTPRQMQLANALCRYAELAAAFAFHQ
jgi:predicted RecB family nuclease